MAANTQEKDFKISIIGAGAAGIGMAILFKKMGIKNVEILERDSVGESFKKWPKETRFISPSFTSNFFGLPDLNAITPDTSPAYNLGAEHPTGLEYAKYLENCVEHFDIKVKTGVEVSSLDKIKSKYIIWAAGEYIYPDVNTFEGIELGLHFSQIKSYKDFKEDEYVVIGAYEAGMDIAIYLLNKGKQITLIDGSDPLGSITSDSSTSLSPYTRDKFKEVYAKIDKKNLNYIKNTRVEKIEYTNNKNIKEYIVTLENGKVVKSNNKPIICTGFEGGTHKLLKDKFEWNGARPLLTDKDESTITPNLFLIGSHIVHDKAVFCFIYKFRQRFAIVAEEIVRRENLKTDQISEILENYKNNNFYLSDLSGCCQDCSC
jgi:putative flavoprotein involved in K+ transport